MTLAPGVCAFQVTKPGSNHVQAFLPWIRTDYLKSWGRCALLSLSYSFDVVTGCLDLYILMSFPLPVSGLVYTPGPEWESPEDRCLGTGLEMQTHHLTGSEQSSIIT